MCIRDRHEQRKLYVAAFAEIDETVARFLSSMKSDSSSPLNKQVSEFIVSANGFVGYLNQLSYL